MGEINSTIKEILSEIYPKGGLQNANMQAFKPNDTPKESTLGQKGIYKNSARLEVKSASGFKMTTESTSNQLEEVYYWFLDFMQGGNKLTVEKIVDNFTSSPGSGHYAEMGQRATIMRDEGMKIFGAINQTVRSALNLVYDLKEFKTRLKNYTDYNEGKGFLREGAFLALKQVWLDAVDLPKRQNGSIHQLSAQLGYTTMREAFMAANTLDELDAMAKQEDGPINEAVIRILKPRFKEFLDWLVLSEKELVKRYNIEKSYLKSQVNTIKLYNSWLKPYLDAAEKLRQDGFETNAALVNAFSTSMFQLTLMGTAPAGESKNRKYKSVVVIDFTFRAHLLQRANQRGDFAPQFGGLINVKGDAYCLNDQELELIKKKMDGDDLLKAAELGDYATDAITELQDEIDEFLDEKDSIKSEKKEEKKQDDTNPFAALAGGLSSLFKPSSYVKAKKGEPITKSEQIKPDNWTEKKLRVNGAKSATQKVLLIYDIYKKSHGMASIPGVAWDEVEFPDEGEMGGSIGEQFSSWE
ncbi:MAG: hypothetical protein ACI83O_000705 [Patescibacteria group bacterium]|jgi:hypothetical protein